MLNEAKHPRMALKKTYQGPFERFTRNQMAASFAPLSMTGGGLRMAGMGAFFSGQEFPPIKSLLIAGTQLFSV